MKIKFYNLGTIKETELDLRPLTVIIGPNNSNKTYIAYSVYGILKQVSQAIRPHKSINFKQTASGSVLSLAEFIKIYPDFICNWASSRFESSLNTFFQDASGKLFENTKYELQVTNEEVLQAIHRLHEHKVFTDPDTKVEYSVFVTDDQVSIRSQDALHSDNRAISNYEAEFRFQRLVQRSLFFYQVLMPAERNAFVITYKMLLNKRFSLLRARERELYGIHDDLPLQLKLLREQGDIRYPQPIEDFLDMLSEIELSHGKFAVPKAAHNNGQNGTGAKDNFADVARQIERYIQGGNQTTFRPTTLGGSELMVHVSKALSIDLYNASSSIKQLAPLLLYLRYRAAENDLLIIDEPEMNLHPESQVKLLEILAILVNAGVRVMLTTHSPYFMSHLNNLVQNEQHSEAVKKRQAASLYLKDPRAFLNGDQVSAYEMRANERGEHYLHSLKDAEFGIRYDTLSDVSVDVQQKYFEIAEKGRTTRRGKGQKAGSELP